MSRVRCGISGRRHIVGLPFRRALPRRETTSLGEISSKGSRPLGRRYASSAGGVVMCTRAEVIGAGRRPGPSMLRTDPKLWWPVPIGNGGCCCWGVW